MNTSRDKLVELSVVNHENEDFYKISNHDEMRPFFMNIVSDSNHWMFISSNGGLTAGRKNPEYAIFPYYTDDKLSEFADITGSKSIFQVKVGNELHIWEPFSERFTDRYQTTRNLYKNIYGNKIMFEEVNHDLGLTFRYQWNSSNLFGFVKKSEIINNSEYQYDILVLDGIQNVMPYGIESDLQATTSNLADAYKRNEIQTDAGMGIFALSAIIVDKAEPSEALKANIAWSTGFDNPIHLLSSLQLNAFRKKKEIYRESDIKGEKGAYFISSHITLPPLMDKKWKIIVNVNQTQTQVVNLCKFINSKSEIDQSLEDDISRGTENLIKLNAASDGLQCTADHFKDTRHFSNVLFNIMRGGIFDKNYQIEKADFVNYLMNSNKTICTKNHDFISSLAPIFTQSELKNLLAQHEDMDLMRLCIEYLPLKFSRRHGDPSRPWNKFSINTQNESDGSKILDYEGNWRDIFQNWEALAHSYPEFIDGMIFKFLNASTFDGYNPYRVTKGGFDWETIEPDNPWSYIGYWGDHQIIYLLKFLEFSEKYHPGKLKSYIDTEAFVYAAVPYIIKPYDQILQNAKDTIGFDHKWDTKIRERRDVLGADGALIRSNDGEIYYVNLMEKILATLLSKISNFIPEGGIWMNTQRPEWNDANNALVGNGVSMVTLSYLRRFLKFFGNLLETVEIENVKISSELVELYHQVREALNENTQLLDAGFTDESRKNLLDRLGFAASEYRSHVYKSGFWGKKRSVSIDGLKRFTQLSIDFMDHSIKVNQRPDKLYHAYNLMSASENKVNISHLSEMLEGQVAVLSSGVLSAQQTLDLLDALKNSALFREDQYSYILYPNKDLPGFLHKNKISKSDVESSALILQLLSDGYYQLVEQDVLGDYHFNGNFRNANDLKSKLEELSLGKYKQLVESDKGLILDIFEKVFHHKAFTGRSGTFFAYEGLGSIYWHMVSKLLLAVQENCIRAIKENVQPDIKGRLLDHYYEIYAGIGVHKSPQLYGAYPTDPYSHTPWHRGAQQPGMTGQVKEDMLVRLGEMGVFVEDGQLYFDPCLLRKEEFLGDPKVFSYVNVNGESNRLNLEKNTLGFTFCQIPVIYTLSNTGGVDIVFTNKTESYDSMKLSRDLSEKIFGRTGEINKIIVGIKSEKLING